MVVFEVLKIVFGRKKVVGLGIWLHVYYKVNVDPLLSSASLCLWLPCLGKILLVECGKKPHFSLNETTGVFVDKHSSHKSKERLFGGF